MRSLSRAAACKKYYSKECGKYVRLKVNNVYNNAHTTMRIKIFNLILTMSAHARYNFSMF